MPAFRGRKLAFLRSIAEFIYRKEYTMNILHYSLGFPPYRTGGLTKFCMDLMTQQAADGHSVALLWPGEFLLHTRKTRIRNRGLKNGIVSFEVQNPTPVSYDEGIVETERFMEEGNQSVYDDFLKKLAPEVIHIHTLMGLHKGLLTAAKSQGIKLAFTTHDFYPVCPKVTMFRDGCACTDSTDCEHCPACNLTALSFAKIRILQSGVYRLLKDNPVVKKLRKQHRDAYLSEEKLKQTDPEKAVKTAADYQKLRKFYNDLLEQMDVIHFNSSVTQADYNRYFCLQNSKQVLIPITHGHIQDHKRKKQFGEKLRITYLAPASAAKGFYMLKEALDTLWNDAHNGRQDFCLNVHFSVEEQIPYLNSIGRYHYGQLEEIFEKTDILVAPSIMHETFGYTVLEALSYGVPVIISDNLGAKDVLPDGGGIVIGNITAEKLAEVIRNLDAKRLQDMNEVIVNTMQLPSVATMSRQIIACYGAEK